MTKFAPTTEQQKILAAFLTGEDVVVEAGAGTGKTSTLVLLAEALAPGKKALYLAFNKSIQLDAAERFPSNTICRTAHSLAFGPVGSRYKHRLNGPRIPYAVTKDIVGIYDGLRLGEVDLPQPALQRLALETVKRFCYTSDTMITAEHVPWVEGVIEAYVDGESRSPREMLEREIVPAARRAWEDIKDPRGTLRFEHDHYLKIWADSKPTLNYDVIFFDEAQDANPVLRDLILAQSHAQRVVVGDANQQIYEWRGAIDALNDFTGLRERLTESFRFGPEIAGVANGILASLDTTMTIVGRGSAGYVGISKDETDPIWDAVLCRTNAGAIQVLLDTLLSNLTAHYVGGSSDIKGFCLAAEDLQNGKRTSYPELAAFSSWAAVEEHAKEDPGAADLATMVTLVNRYTPRVIIDALSRTVSEADADVVISTAHKAKGREWDRVSIYMDFDRRRTDTGRAGADVLLPPPSDAYLRLAYVAVTRAKKAVHLGPLPGSIDTLAESLDETVSA